MLILGIETSCDETAAALLEVANNKVRALSNVISSQVKLHAKYGGVVPSLAAREHVRNLPKVLKLALLRSNLNNVADVDLIATTRGPGLVSSLLVGTTFAKTLAWKYQKPIIGVNHMEGHIASNWLPPVGGNYQLLITNYQLPALCLIVSGGHTELVLMRDFGKYKILGQTLDDAAGEAFDKIARILGLGYPGGPAISAEAEKLVNSNWLLVDDKKGGGQPTTNLPRPMINSKDFNFSFAGLKTAVLYLVRDLTKSPTTMGIFAKMPIVRGVRTAIAVEAQQAIVDVLVTKTIRAAEKYKVKSIMLSGGVSANRLLRSNLNKAAEQKGLRFFKPEMEYATDNAAMIALAGYLTHIKNKSRQEIEIWQSVLVDANLTL